jgi:thiol-disulfide isomerase/thioredoxin
MLPAEQAGGLPRDGKDGAPLLLGIATRDQLLAHRAVFRDNTAKAELPEAWRARWASLDTPVVLVAAFGSWCGDTQRELPDLLALHASENPFISVHYLGVYRDKKAAAGDWPAGITPQPVVKVPTFWLFAAQPGGSMKLVDTIVENPPKKGQRMAEAVLEMLDKAR